MGVSLRTTTEMDGPKLLILFVTILAYVDNNYAAERLSRLPTNKIQRPTNENRENVRHNILGQLIIQGENLVDGLGEPEPTGHVETDQRNRKVTVKPSDNFLHIQVTLRVLESDDYNKQTAPEQKCSMSDPKKRFSMFPGDERVLQTDKPPKPDASQLKRSPPTSFRKLYEREDFPVALEHNTNGNKLVWKVEIDKLDYNHYLPIFFDGLSETDHPYDFIAKQGIHDMLEHGGSKILPVIPQLIVPIKNALNTRDPQVLSTTLKVLQHLVVSDDMVGEALVPYYRQILPVLNIFKNKNLNSGDMINYNQQKRENLGGLIQATLETFERHGGEDAFINIKSFIPSYESCKLK